MKSKLLATTLVGLALTASGLAATPAEAATYPMTVKTVVNLRASATTTSKIVGKIPAGGKVDIRCHVRGQKLTDSKGRVSDIWDRTASGAYVWDGLVQTGRMTPVVPPCSNGGSKPSTGAAKAKTAITAFVKKYNKVWIDYDGAYGAQCVDLSSKFAAVNGLPIPRTGNGYAHGIYDLYNTNGNARNYTRIANTPTNFPRPGDTIVWKKSYNGWAGHVAVVVSATKDKVTVFEQNSGSDKRPTVRTYNYAHVAGWLRPKAWA